MIKEIRSYHIKKNSNFGKYFSGFENFPEGQNFVGQDIRIRY